MLTAIRALVASKLRSGITASVLLGASLVCLAVSFALTLPLSGPVNRPLEVYQVGCVAGAIALIWVLWSLFGKSRTRGLFRISNWFLLAATVFMIGSICGMLAMGYARSNPLIDNLVQTSGILTYIATAAALFTLPAAKTPGSRRLPWVFDVALIVMAISGAGWYFLVAPQVQLSGGNRFTIWLTFAYPLANLVSIASVVAAASLGGPFRSARGLIIAGIVLNVLGDLVQSIHIQRGLVPPTGLIFSVWIASTLLIGLAALQARHDHEPSGAKGELPSRGAARAAVPILFLSALVILALWGNVERAGKLDAIGLNIACVIAIVCCLGRMLCLLQDNAELSASLEAANESLDAQVRDRTAQLSAALDELENQRGFLRAVIDALPSYVVSQGSKGEILLANNAALRMFGSELELYPRSEPTGAFIASGLTVSGEQVLHCTDGNDRTFEVVKSPVGASRDQLLVVGNDVTVRKEAERTLIEARNAAEDANRVKSEFLAKVSHELRTPLHGIIGLSELLLSENLSHAEREMASNIRASAGSLQAVLMDVLDLSNPDATSEVREDSLCNLCSEVAEAYRSRAAAKGLRLRADLHLDPEQVFEADVHRVRQILSHLLANAVKFTERGEVAFEAQIKAQSGRCATVQFVIEDTGIGFPAEQEERAFQPFEQLDNSMQRKYGGAGLGLSICKLFVEQLGGTMELASAVGSGSRFTVELPLSLVEVTRKKAGARALDGMRVLVAEDNLVNQMILKRQLERLGCAATMANDGEEVLALMRQMKFDAILMDCQMPHLDGLEAARRIRSAGNPVPIVAVTANAMPGDRERCISAGMDDYLAKPIRMESLEQVLARLAIFRSAA